MGDVVESAISEIRVRERVTAASAISGRGCRHRSSRTNDRFSLRSALGGLRDETLRPSFERERETKGKGRKTGIAGGVTGPEIWKSSPFKS